MSMRTIKASELGSFLYCKRAWWYQLQGEVSANQEQMDAGAEAHQSHARRVKFVPLLILAAFILIAIALVLLWVKR